MMKHIALQHVLESASICLCLLALPIRVSAGGFALSEVDSAASGRGYTATTVDSPSAVFYNPANVSRLSGVQVSLGVSALMPRWRYAPIAGGPGRATTSEWALSFPPAAFATAEMGRFSFGDLAAGLGFYVPYGSALSWPEDWAGRTRIQEITLQIFELSPVLSLRPHKAVAIGAGLRILPGVVFLQQAVEFGPAASGEVEMSGRGWGVGASAGVSAFPLEGLAVALVWRSPVTIDFSGDSDFQFPPPFDTEANDRPVETSVPLPQILRLAVGYDLLPKKLNIAAGVEYQMWHTFEELEITFIEESGPNESVVSPRDSKNSWVVRTGAEYKADERLTLRLGYVFDQKTQPERTVNPAPPDSDRHVIALGASYAWTDLFGIKKLAVHAHFLNVFFAARETRRSFPLGTYTGAYPGNTTAYVAGLSVSAAFDTGPLWRGSNRTHRGELGEQLTRTRNIPSSTVSDCAGGAQTRFQHETHSTAYRRAPNKPARCTGVPCSGPT